MSRFARTRCSALATPPIGCAAGAVAWGAGASPAGALVAAIAAASPCAFYALARADASRPGHPLSGALLRTVRWAPVLAPAVSVAVGIGGRAAVAAWVVASTWTLLAFALLMSRVGTAATNRRQKAGHATEVVPDSYQRLNWSGVGWLVSALIVLGGAALLDGERPSSESVGADVALLSLIAAAVLYFKFFTAWLDDSRISGRRRALGAGVAVLMGAFEVVRRGVHDATAVSLAGAALLLVGIGAMEAARRHAVRSYRRD